MRRSFRTMARVTTALIAGAVVTFVAAYAGLLVAGYKPVAVYSGSMVPTLGVGSLAVDRVVTARSVRVGDVITFDDPYVKGRLVTHRVVKIVPTKHGLAYRTKGDANPARDPWAIQLGGNVGRVVRGSIRGLRPLVRAHARGTRRAAGSVRHVPALRCAAADLAQ
jgi:signal peptidase I